MSFQVLIAPAALAAVVSITGLTALARAAYDPKQPRSLSEMATLSPRKMVAFRSILYPCSVLFGITILAFVAPRSSLTAIIAAAGFTMCASEMVLATFPGVGKTKLTHDLFGYLMGAAMVILAISFAVTLNGAGRLIEVGIVGAMAVLFVATFLDKRRFIVYELSYIYLSHVSIVIVALYLAPKP